MHGRVTPVTLRRRSFRPRLLLKSWNREAVHRDMQPRRKNPYEEKQLDYEKQRREHAWFNESGLRILRRRRKTTRSRAARRAEHQQLSQGGLPVEEAETLPLDETRTKYKRWKARSESLRESLTLNETRRERREGRKNPEARQRRAERRSSQGGKDEATGTQMDA